MDLISRLLDAHPGAAVLAGILLVVATWTQTQIVFDLRWMRKNVVSKEHLDAALSEQQRAYDAALFQQAEKFAETFVSRELCQAMQVKSNGHGVHT